MKKYKKIDKDEMFNYMVTNRLTGDFYEVLFSASRLSKWIGISKYLARKNLIELKKENKIEYKCMIFHEYGEYGKIEYTSQPICGFIINGKFLNEAKNGEQSEAE